MKDILCFHAFENYYGIPLTMLQETFDEQKVTPVPFLNHLFTGLCNHNGIIYPVLSFSRLCQKDIPDKRCCMLLLRVGEYELILRMNDIPFIVHERDITNEAPYEGGVDDLKIYRICQKGDQLIYILDMGEIIKNLSDHMLEI